MFYPKYKTRQDIENWSRFIKYVKDPKNEWDLAEGQKLSHQKWFSRFIFGDLWTLCSWHNQDNGKSEYVISF